jgi:hypothetical protein
MFQHKKPLIAQCIELAGTLPAGILAYRLLHWTKNGTAGFERDGQKWVSLPNATWCADTGLTPKQLRSAFESLVGDGLMDVFGPHGRASASRPTIGIVRFRPTAH